MLSMVHQAKHRSPVPPLPDNTMMLFGRVVKIPHFVHRFAKSVREYTYY
jgi:hypothetical protein